MSRENYGKWTQAKLAILNGSVVFFPRTEQSRVYSILAYERKKGLKITVKKAVYSECPGVVAWKV